MEWFRWYHGAVSDDKWPLIARRSHQPVAVVVAVWAALLECASQAGKRGSVEGFDPESMDALLQLEDGSCLSVLNALSSGKKPRISDGRIVRWEDRQPQREDGSAERAKEWRARKKAEKEEGSGTANAARAHCERAVNAARTHSERGANAAQTQTNTEQRREEKNREDPILQSTAGNTDPAHATSELERCENAAEGEHHFLHDAPGIEFQELREFYNAHCRDEAPLTGFAEYKQLRASKRWPGQNRIYEAIEAHAQANPGGWTRFAPGLVRFLREHWWDKKPIPYAPAATRPISGGNTLSNNMATGAAVLAARKARRNEDAKQ